MDCNLINADINACTVNAFKGYKRTGWFTMKSNIDEASVVISNATVKFGLKSGMFYEIYDDSMMPFNGSGVTVEVSSNHGYKFFNPTVKFPVKPFNPEYANVVSALAKGSELVVILEQEEKGTDDTSRYVVFGLQGGLVCTTPTFEMANDSVWEIELVEQRADNPALFLYDTDLAGTTALKTLLTEYEYISGLSLASGTVTPQHIFMQVDSTTTSYIILPDGALLTSTAGFIEGDWSGAAGSIILIVDKTTELFSLDESEFNGNMNFSVLAKTSIILDNNQFTTEECDFILGIIIANGAITDSRTISFIDNVESPTNSIVEDAEELGWTVPF